jgi:hypothetical protein
MREAGLWQYVSSLAVIRIMKNFVLVNNAYPLNVSIWILKYSFARFTKTYACVERVLHSRGESRIRKI